MYNQFNGNRETNHSNLDKDICLIDSRKQTRTPAESLFVRVRPLKSFREHLRGGPSPLQLAWYITNDNLNL